MSQETISAPVQVDTEGFEKLMRSELPVLVDFWAQWCGPCRMIGPVLEELAQDYQGRLIVAKVNVDEHPDLAAKYAIRSIPNLKLFKQGQQVEDIVGALPKPMMERYIEKHV